MAIHSKSEERRCRRCGCTEEKACEGGCAWIPCSQICSQCLTPEEEMEFHRIRLLYDLAEQMSIAFGHRLNNTPGKSRGRSKNG